MTWLADALGYDPFAPPPGSPDANPGLLDAGQMRKRALSQGLLQAGAAMLTGGDPRQPQGWGQTFGRGLQGFSQGSEQGSQDYRRDALTKSQIGYQDAELAALKSKTAAAQAQMAARQRIAGGLMGGGGPSAGGQPAMQPIPNAPMGGAGSQLAQAPGGVAMQAPGGEGGPGWDVYLHAALDSLSVGDDDAAARYLEIAKASPGYDAQKALALIPAKLKEQQALMPGKVQEAGLTAGAEAGARLPSQKSLAAYDSGLALNRGMTLAQFNKKLDVDNAGAIATAQANAAGNSPTQRNTNTEKLADDYRADKNVLNYQTVVPIYASMQDALKRPGGASDLNLVYGLAKILDPASVVREGETWMVRDTSNLPQEIQGLIGKVTSGQRLPDDLRLTLVTEAGSRVAALKQANDTAKSFYTDRAKALMIDPARVVYDITPPAAAASPSGQAQPLSDDDLVKKYGAH